MSNDPKEVEDLLELRDEAIATDSEGVDVAAVLDEIESEEIRELGRIVLETTDGETFVFSTT